MLGKIKLALIKRLFLMFRKFKDFINNNLKEIKIPLGEDFVYGIKNVTNEIEEKYEKLKTELNKPLWDINKT